MQVISGLVSILSAVICFALLFVLVCVGLVLWYWKNQPKMEVADTAPTPPVAATIEHPTAAEERTAPAPAAPAEPVTPPAEPPSADA